jgi:hypothetical protein
MRAQTTIGAIGLFWLLAACAPALPSGEVNSAVFARRPPPPARPSYLETIKYIDDGLKYQNPQSEFLISPVGELCFRGAMEITIRKLANFHAYWCMEPGFIAQVDALDNNVSFIRELRLWCNHAGPDCAHKVGYNEFPVFGSYGYANTITVQAIPYRKEKSAIEYLIYLMGGNPPAGEPF